MAAASAVQWGDVATWVGGIATAIALLLTYALLLITRREQKDVQSEKRQAQARLVSAWSSRVQQLSDGSIRSVSVILKNSSDEPVYEVRAAVGSRWEGTVIDYSEVDIEYVMPPKSQQEQTTSLELPQSMIESPESSLPVELLFRDAAGIYWHRDRFGRLTHIAEDSLRGGERYFFKAAARPGQLR